MFLFSDMFFLISVAARHFSVAVIWLSVTMFVFAGCREGEQHAGEKTTSSAPSETEISHAPKVKIRSTGSDAAATGEIPTRGIEVSQQDVQQWKVRLTHARFRQIKPVSSRSKSLRLMFAGGDSAIFKPLLKGDSSGRLEVAFFRLASLLGVHNVPVSVMRPIYPDRFERVLEAKGPETFSKFMDTVARDKKGRVWGAMIQWLKNLAPIGAEDGKGRLDVKQLFADESYRPLWKNLSDVIILDYLLANWDRFSGGNLFRFSDSNELALIDHNEAFYRLNRRQKEMLTESLHAVPCVSSELVEKLRGLDEKLINSAIEETNWHGELLRAGEIRNILIRKDTLLAFIDDRITDAKGTDAWKCR